MADKHYLQVTESHFSRATADNSKALQNPVQQSAVGGCNEPQGQTKGLPETPILQLFANDCDWLQLSKVAETGLEPVREFPPTGF